ncbi:GNAT family N-acetyltransferase [Natronolimnobius baerhuensis]|uniref:N-acetyltransferase n=1 Tax=Natronolimnobius baerhuensis TaxID=253108 RepID=A0A202EDZ6_9EURY|nr:GNAT family N-acetyltransferase [Natronolimnobius baerhuensis]OVE86451.1 N-acetyltransferase [Natronolimnobius baerhuensis]
MTEPTIAYATSDDLEAVTDRWVDLARGQRAYGSSIYADDNRETMSETLAAHQFTDSLLVARLEGNLVGFASFSLEQGALELETTRGMLSNLYVDPAYRGRGIGTALLEAVEAEVADRGADVLRLEVMAANEDARRFYRNHGYDAVRMTMDRTLGAQSENDTHSKEDT